MVRKRNLNKSSSNLHKIGFSKVRHKFEETCYLGKRMLTKFNFRLSDTQYSRTYAITLFRVCTLHVIIRSFSFFFTCITLPYWLTVIRFFKLQGKMENFFYLCIGIKIIETSVSFSVCLTKSYSSYVSFNQKTYYKPEFSSLSLKLKQRKKCPNFDLSESDTHPYFDCPALTQNCENWKKKSVIFMMKHNFKQGKSNILLKMLYKFNLFNLQWNTQVHLTTSQTNKWK